MDDRTIDTIFAGSLENLPSVSSKIVRIFTSSTFTDTTMERNTLMAKCYPKIKDYCREKHGLEFQVMMWPYGTEWYGRIDSVSRWLICVGVLGMRRQMIIWRPNCACERYRIVRDYRWDRILLSFWAKNTVIVQYQPIYYHLNCKWFAMNWALPAMTSH